MKQYIVQLEELEATIHGMEAVNTWDDLHSRDGHKLESPNLNTAMYYANELVTKIRNHNCTEVKQFSNKKNVAAVSIIVYVNDSVVDAIDVAELRPQEWN